MLLHSAWVSNKFCTGLLHSCSTRTGKDYWSANHRSATQAAQPRLNQPRIFLQWERDHTTPDSRRTIID